MNKTIINAQVVAHSINPQGDENISIFATFPRIILAEVNTHRMLSKNTSSSRAIPFTKMVEAIKNDPFIPIAWQRSHSGMQGTEYVENQDMINWNIEMWETARDNAIKIATELTECDVTKQLANRLLEPFMWTTMLITGSRSGWENFFHLRCPSYVDEAGNIYKSKRDFIRYTLDPTQTWMTDESSMEWFNINQGQAEIHMMALAECICDAVNASTPKQLKAGEWHIPFEDKLPKLKVAYTDDGLDYKERCTLEDKIAMSVAMAARTSYTVVGNEKELNAHALINLHDRLLAQDPPHSSPLEHCAVAMTEEEYYLFSKGMDGQADHEHGWCNNLKGFIPYRYLIDNKRTIW